MAVPTNVVDEKALPNGEVRFIIDCMGKRSMFMTKRNARVCRFLYLAADDNATIDSPDPKYYEMNGSSFEGDLKYVQEIAQNLVKLVINKDRIRNGQLKL